MAIKVNNVNAIDDSRNISASGIATVGSGSSAIVINGTTGVINVGTGITLSGVAGNISIAGTINAGGFNVPAQIISFRPANGATGINYTDSDITITFDQAVGIATTGTILVREGSTSGPVIKTLGVGDILSTTNGIILRVNTVLGPSTTIHPVIPNGFIKSTSGNFVGLNTTGASSYSFTTKVLALGDSFGGGFLICQSGGTRWVVAPSSTEVSRNWYTRTDANTTAQANSGCTGWFIPTSAQLQNPGYLCRQYWNSYSASFYWSDSELDSGRGRYVNMANGVVSSNFPNDAKTSVWRVRSFRCVTY